MRPRCVEGNAPGVARAYEKLLQRHTTQTAFRMETKGDFTGKKDLRDAVSFASIDFLTLFTTFPLLLL